MKKIVLLLLTLTIMLSFYGCTGVETSENQNIIVDSMGREVVVPDKPQKLVSGYYISTYTLINLGLQDYIVGVESKAETRSVYKMFAPRLIQAPDVGSAKAVNTETIISLDPDLVILPFHQIETADMLEQMGIPVIVVRPESIDDFLYVLDILGESTNTSDKAKSLKDWFCNAWNNLEQRTRDLEKKKVYMCSPSEPLNALTPQMFQSEIIKAAGGELVTQDIEGSYWVKISMEQLYNYKPEYMFISSNSSIAPEDLLEESNWSRLTTNIYSMPSKVEGWDNPTLSSVLCAYYVAAKIHPDVVSLDEVDSLAKEFYSLAYDAENITSDQLSIE